MELVRIGGVTPRDATSHDAYLRDLWERAKRAGRIRAGMLNF
jgi:hypothetical protein